MSLQRRNIKSSLPNQFTSRQSIAMDQSQIQTEQTQHTVSTTDMSIEESLSLARNRIRLPTRGFPPEDGGPKYHPPATYMVWSDTPEEELTSESPHQTQVSTTARSPPTAPLYSSCSSGFDEAYTPKQTPSFQQVRKTSSGQASSGDAPSGKKGGSAPPDKGAASKKSFHNRFSSLPLVTLDAAESTSTTDEDNTPAPEKPKRKWKHSKLFPKNKLADTSAGHSRSSRTKPSTPATRQTQKSPLLMFTVKEWAMILGVDIKDYLPGAKYCAHTSKRKEPKEKKPVEPFTMESFIRTGRAMTEDQKRTFIQKAAQEKDDFLGAISLPPGHTYWRSKVFSEPSTSHCGSLHSCRACKDRQKDRF
jgi:hypothetical protein